MPRRKSTTDYGRERALAHIEEARAFSAEVGDSDSIVKDAFFALSASARNHLLDKYESAYGSAARVYAQQTIPKWRSGSVQMSGMVAQRLFSLVPPFMPIAQKHRVFETIWKKYGPTSRKFLYFGPDSDPQLVLTEIEKYFDGLNVLYKIPANLERRFDWLSDNDVNVKQQLLIYFMNEQRKAAIAAARLNLDMMLEQMKVADFAQVSKLSHTLLVGNHQLEMQADPLRTGFIFSDSGREAKKPRQSFGCAPTLLVVLIGILIVAWLFGSAKHSQPSIQETVSTIQAVEPGQRASSGATQAVTEDQTRANSPTSVSSTGGTSGSIGVRIGVPSVPAGTARATAQPALPTPVSTVLSAARQIAAAKAPASCTDTVIASMEDDGATLRTSDGSTFVVSKSGVMRYMAAQWSTGDAVSVCAATGADGITYASVSNPKHYSKVQASLAASKSPSSVSCSDVKLVGMSDGGATIATTDGLIMQVSSAGTMRYESAQWSTGDSVQVCKTTLPNGGVAASIENPSHFQKVQASVVNQTHATDVLCKSASIAYVSDGGATVGLSGGDSYTISLAGVMRYEAQQWSTGDPVEVCEAKASDGSIAASIKNPAHFQKVEALRL